MPGAPRARYIARYSPSLTRRASRYDGELHLVARRVSEGDLRASLFHNPLRTSGTITDVRVPLAIVPV
jgi:hypothetical protein